MSGVADVERIRADFPALRRIHRGQPVAYFDGPGGTQVPAAVAEAVSDYLLNHNANTHWAYPGSEETDAMLDDARHVFAAFLNAAPDEVVFGNNMTTLTMHLARGLGRAWRAGDEIVVTELDHHANIAPWQALERERGVVLRWLPLDVATGRLEVAHLPRLLNGRTRLVALGAASNALGTITDVAPLAAMAHDAGALVFIDAVHLAPHHLPDVAALGADLLACSTYKFYGPHGGVLWGRRELLDRVDVPRLAPAPAEAPERLETGTQNHEAIVGGAAAVRWLAGLAGTTGALRTRLAEAYAGLESRAARLFRDLWEGIGALPGVTCWGPPPGTPRTATLAFTVKRVPSRRVAEMLAERGCFVSHGDFYAATVVERLGVAPDGLVRAGLAAYATAGEVDRLIDGVAALAG
jgi:cysteine desulfurase family protein (TIGR01976 family)